jgi:hypothetical protein
MDGTTLPLKGLFTLPLNPNRLQAARRCLETGNETHRIRYRFQPAWSIGPLRVEAVLKRNCGRRSDNNRMH